MWEAFCQKDVYDAFAKKTSLPCAVLLLRQKFLLVPWHAAFVLIKMWYGLRTYVSDIHYIHYILVICWFCVFLRHIIFKRCWYIGSRLGEFQLHLHTCYHQKAPNKNPRVFPKNFVFFLVLRFYRFRVLLEVLKIQPNDPPNDPRTTPRTTPDSWVARRIDHNMKCGTPCATAPLLHPKPSNKENERPSHPKEVCKRNDQRDVSPM